MLAGIAHAADPADDSASESQAIQGDEGKSTQSDQKQGSGSADTDSDNDMMQKEYDRENDQ
jgi:hypothetical protein